MSKDKLPLFSAYGVELEYMIVDEKDLSVMPLSDKLIYDAVGSFENEIVFEKIAWSNELVLHVLELKTNGPARSLLPLASYFQTEIQKINRALMKYHAKLLPTGAHPWMNPSLDAKLWQHGNSSIYAAYDKIFDCRGHGWSNLQSVHLNLPFANDVEFAKLHTAVRLVLPLIPSLAASTPIIDATVTGFVDARLEFYRCNQQKIPIITGDIIPELVFSEKQYEEEILQKMYQAVAPYDEGKVLQEEWLNSRGAIARFERNTIEIRIIDIQECPKADLAIINLLVAVLKALVNEYWISFEEQTAWTNKQLKSILLASIKEGLPTCVSAEYAAIFGCVDKKQCSLRRVWQHILADLFSLKLIDSHSKNVLQFILKEGNVAERILKCLNKKVPLVDIYQSLARCLEKGKLFLSDENNCNV